MRTLALGALLHVVPVQDATLQDATPPNVLILLADDLGWADLACYGSASTATPHLDQLAADGARFTDFYAGAPNCSPSRAALLTGRVPARAGMYNYIPPDGPHHLRAEETTLAELLAGVGYQTVHVGKWHLCHDLESDELPQAQDHGFQHSFATENNASPSHEDPANFVRDGEPVGPLEGYSCDLVAGELLSWLDEAREPARPFLACAWFHETHTPIASPPALVARHPDAAPKDARYYANVENLDAAVGRLLDGLEQRGLADDTLVLFASDNGGLRAESNGPLRGRKSFVWEGGIRVPGIVRWPGRVPPGAVVAEPAGLVDVLPTLCEVAGVAAPTDRPIDGTSLLPLLEGRPLERATPLFWFFYRTRPAAALREGDWVVVGYPGSEVPPSHRLTAEQQAWLAETPLERFELYDLADDLAQERDRAADDPERLARLRDRLVALHAEVVAEGPRWTFEAGGSRDR